MCLAATYPTVESLPDVPLRLKGGRQFRRLLWIGVLGAVGVVAALWVVRLHLLNLPPPRNPWMMLGILLVLFSSIGLLGLLGKVDIEVSREGVQNFGLFGKGALLRWADFREQRVKDGNRLASYELTTPTPPRLRNGQFVITNVVEQQAEWLKRLIDSQYVRPAPPAPPPILFTWMKTFSQPVRLVMASELGLTLIEGSPEVQALGGRLDRINRDLRTARLTLAVDESTQEEATPSKRAELQDLQYDTECELQKQLAALGVVEKEWKDCRVSWDKVESVEVWKLEHGRHDFARLRMQVAGKQIEWRRRIPGRDADPNFSGADADQWLAILRQHVPADRFKFSAYTGRPLSLEEWDRRHEQIVVPTQKSLRSTRWWVLIGAPLFLALLSIVGNWAQAVAFLVFYGPMGVGFWYFKRRELRELERRYADWRDQVEHSNSESTG